MKVSIGLSAPRAFLLVVTAIAIVHLDGDARIAAKSPAKGTAEPTVTTKQAAPAIEQAPLPAPVAEMRDAILAAVKSGRVEDLRTPVEWNEIRPEAADRPVDDLIAYWKQVSGDGEGREILAILGEIIDAGHTTVPLGKDIENNRLYVWPAIAELPLDRLTPEQEVQLYRLVKPAEAKVMRERKKWTWYRLVIGADGTWHAFQKSD